MTPNHFFSVAGTTIPNSTTVGELVRKCHQNSVKPDIELKEKEAEKVPRSDTIQITMLNTLRPLETLSAQFLSANTIGQLVDNYCRSRKVKNKAIFQWRAKGEVLSDRSIPLAAFNARYGNVVEASVNLPRPIVDHLKNLYAQLQLSDINNLINYVGVCHPEWTNQRINNCAQCINEQYGVDGPSGSQYLVQVDETIRRMLDASLKAAWRASSGGSFSLDASSGGSFSLESFLYVYALSFHDDDPVKAMQELRRTGYQGPEFVFNKDGSSTKTSSTKTGPGLLCQRSGVQDWEFEDQGREAGASVGGFSFSFGTSGRYVGRYGDDTGPSTWIRYSASAQKRLETYIAATDWGRKLQGKCCESSIRGPNGQDYVVKLQEEDRDDNYIYFTQLNRKYHTQRRVRARIVDDSRIPKPPEPTVHPAKELPIPGYWSGCTPAQAKIGGTLCQKPLDGPVPLEYFQLGNTFRSGMMAGFGPGSQRTLRAFVSHLFSNSCPKTIVKIEAVVNQSLFRKYSANYFDLSRMLGPALNECLVFHGTDKSSVPKIIASGFDRNFGGKNAEAFGHGVYFALNASYSARSMYAKPDSNNHQRVFLSRVIAGEYVVGSAADRHPANKPAPLQNYTYESFVDNVDSPTVVVATRDYMAYPEFLITFR